MAFKKAKGKGGKKKAKKSGGKRDEWSHEGGVVLDGKDDENQDEDGNRKRRTTQDREESIRRSKLKNNDRKRKQDFYKKMAKKVKFDDVAKENAAEDSEEEADVPTLIREVRLNPLPVLDRLQVFVAKSMRERHGSDDDSDHDESGEGADDGDSASSGESMYSGSEGEGEGIGEEGREVDGAVDDQDVNDEDAEYDSASDNDSVAPKNGDENSKGEFYYEHMFHTEHAVDTCNESAKMSRLAVIPGEDFEIYGKLNFQENNSEGQLPLGTGPYSSVAQMPGLHKLFRGSAACSRIDPKTFPGVNSHLLPYLASYADAFLEGRDHRNDAHLLQGMLVHAVTHTVKARYGLLHGPVSLGYLHYHGFTLPHCGLLIGPR
jgi:hypothetical protein